MEILYQAEVTSSGGRDGEARSADGRLVVSLAMPPGLGGHGGPGTNPEQLFAAGYSACFLSALKYVAAQHQHPLPDGSTVTALVGIGEIATGFNLRVTLRVNLPGMDRHEALQLMDRAHQICPYSNATRGNIHIDLQLQ